MRNNFNKGFTLVEILAVVAILATIVTATVVVMNPVEMLQQAEDAVRLNDINSIHQVLTLFRSQRPGGSIGEPNIVYVSIPSASSTCVGAGLPALPIGWEYRCVPATDLRRIDGNGWIPVNFAAIPGRIPFTILPIDPVNTAASGSYYAFVVTGGRWEIFTPLMSQRHGINGGASNMVSRDGGNDPYIYEAGTNLNIFSQEILRNADFATGNLHGWNIWAGGTTGIVTSPVRREGGHSAIIQNSNSFCNNYYAQDLSVLPNTTYTISAWVRTTNEVGTASVGIANTAWGGWHESRRISGTNDWTYLSVSKNSGTNTTLRFFLAVLWCGGPSPGSGPSGTTFFTTPSVRSGTILFNR